MDRPVLVYTTYPSLVEAEQAGRLLTEKGLAYALDLSLARQDRKR